MTRFAVEWGDRTFYAYALTARQAVSLVRSTVPNIPTKPALKVRLADHRDEATQVEDQRRAPGA